MSIPTKARTFIGTGLLLGLLLSASYLTPQTTPDGTNVEFGRLAFTLPGPWKLTPRGKTMQATSPAYPASALLLVEPGPATTLTAAEFLSRGVQGMERGKKVLNRFPAKPAVSRTRTGVPFAFQVSLTQPPGRSGRLYTAYYAFATGNKYQVVIAYIQTSAEFKKLVKELARSFESIHAKTSD